MLASPRSSIPKRALYSALFGFQATCELAAQNFTARTATLSPFGVNGPLPFGMMSETDGVLGMKGGVNAGVGISSTYNSNVFLSEDDPESDVTLSLSPSLNYTSDPEGGARVVVVASYSPSASASLNNSDLNSFDQSGSLSVIVSGSRTTISAFAGVSQISGADELAVSQGFFTGTAVSLGLQASYQLAPRTTVSAGWSSSITNYGDGTTSEGSEADSAVGFNGYALNVGASWAATERFSFGPNLSYSTSGSDNTEDFDTTGFSVVASYKFTEKIQIAGSLGIQSADYSEGGESRGISPTGSLNASYQIDELWALSGSIQSGLTPSPTGSNYVINGWSLSSSLSRQLLIGSAGIGLNMNFSNFERAGPVGISSRSQDSQENIGVSVSYSRPLFSDRLGFSTSLRYAVNYGDIEYSQLQLNAGLSLSF